MANFVKPIGINFRSDHQLSSHVLWKSVCLVVSFLQSVDPYKELHWYWDFWEHNGSEESIWLNKQIDFHQLFYILDSPRNLLSTLATDDDVFIGIAPSDHAWYLRFYMNWDDEGLDLIGRFDITLPVELASHFRDEVAKALPTSLAEQDSQTYYASLFGG